jgi:hypothetical protein
VQRQLRGDLAEQFLEAVDDLAVPGHELRSVVDVRRLVDLVLLEPERHGARNGVGSVTRIRPTVQLHQRVPQQRAFGRINGRDITTDSISKSHENTSQAKGLNA